MVKLGSIFHRKLREKINSEIVPNFFVDHFEFSSDSEFLRCSSRPVTLFKYSIRLGSVLLYAKIWNLFENKIKSKWKKSQEANR